VPTTPGPSHRPVRASAPSPPSPGKRAVVVPPSLSELESYRQLAASASSSHRVEPCCSTKSTTVRRLSAARRRVQSSYDLELHCAIADAAFSGSQTPMSSRRAPSCADHQSPSRQLQSSSPMPYGASSRFLQRSLGEPPFPTTPGDVRPQNESAHFPSSAWCARQAPSSSVARASRQIWVKLVRCVQT
jgi:hypothetical protein